MRSRAAGTAAVAVAAATTGAGAAGGVGAILGRRSRRARAEYALVCDDVFGGLGETTHAVNQLHCTQRGRVRVRQAKAMNKDCDALRSRDRDVETVGVKEEV